MLKKYCFSGEFCLTSRMFLVLVLLFASVERCFVSRMRDFFNYKIHSNLDWLRSWSNICCRGCSTLLASPEKMQAVFGGSQKSPHSVQTSWPLSSLIISLDTTLVGVRLREGSSCAAPQFFSGVDSMIFSLCILPKWMFNPFSVCNLHSDFWLIVFSLFFPPLLPQSPLPLAS